jgi:hypothetical protein
MPSARPLASLPDTLQQIQERLSEGLVPQQVIEELSPSTRADAVTWIRRLSIWAEYTEQFPVQTVAIARLISQRARREFSLKLTEDGRVIDSQHQGPSWQTPRPTSKFRLKLQGEEVGVEYTPYYFPDGRTDLIYFISPHEPPQPHCLSETGHLSRLTPHDVVVACGGAEAYAVLFAEAHLRGEVKAFEAVFEGNWPESKHRRGRKPPTTTSEVKNASVVGTHTAQVIAEQEDNKATSQPPHQRTLFEEMP